MSPSGPVTRLGDDFAYEARNLTDAEFRTHVESLVWSNSRGLDLLVPKRDLKRFAYSPDAGTAADGLVGKGWWADRDECWYVGLRFPEWQLERAAVEQRREAGALYARRHRMHKAGDYSLWGPPPAACELCGQRGGRIVWEHCHAHNHHRGWTCDRCNAVLREVDKRPDDARTWEQAGEQVWLYWLRCGECASRPTASPFAFPADADPAASS
jgi:Recombination endonuclease VII